MQKLRNGSLRRRSDGRWEIRYYDNAQQKSIYAKTQREVIDKFHEIKKQNLLKLVIDLLIDYG